MYSIRPRAPVWWHYIISRGYWAGEPAEWIALPASRARLRSDHTTDGGDFSRHSFSPPTKRTLIRTNGDNKRKRYLIPILGWRVCRWVSPTRPLSALLCIINTRRRQRIHERGGRTPGFLGLRDQTLMLTHFPATLHTATLLTCPTKLTRSGWSETRREPSTNRRSAGRKSLQRTRRSLGERTDKGANSEYFHHSGTKTRHMVQMADIDVPRVL